MTPGDSSRWGASIGVAVITHAARRHLPHCLPPYLSSPLRPRILVVNSSSGDGTVELARELGAETLVIPRRAFNHGSTRELARRHLATDIVCMATPDAYPVDEQMLGKLVAPLLEGRASVAYARQVPREAAGTLERFGRQFNYPDRSHVRGLGDAAEYGSYLFFCSDACSAYRNRALDEIGGFRSTLTDEDALAVAMLLQKGHRIAYVAEAMARHSHPCRLIGDARRAFDKGYARKVNRPLLSVAGKDEGLGLRYFRALMKELAGRAPHLMPYAFAHTFARWLGYRMGATCTHGPAWLCKALSSQDYYWTSDDYRRASALRR